MKKFFFDLITSPFSLFENPIYDYLAMALIGAVAFVIAYRTVGELGLRGEAGSIAHWIIRFIVFSVIWLICCLLIKIVYYVIDNWITIIICAIMMLLIFIAKKYANVHPNSFLNKKLF